MGSGIRLKKKEEKKINNKQSLLFIFFTRPKIMYIYLYTPFEMGADYILSIINTNNTNHHLVDELHTK